MGHGMGQKKYCMPSRRSLTLLLRFLSGFPSTPPMPCADAVRPAPDFWSRGFTSRLHLFCFSSDLLVQAPCFSSCALSSLVLYLLSDAGIVLETV